MSRKKLIIFAVSKYFRKCELPKSWEPIQDATFNFIVYKPTQSQKGTAQSSEKSSSANAGISNPALMTRGRMQRSVRPLLL